MDFSQDPEGITDIEASVGSSVHDSYEGGGPFKAKVTVDVNFIDFQARLGGGEVRGQSGVCVSFKPGILLLIAAVVVIVVVNPLPDEVALPALLERGRRLFEGARP